MCCGISDDVGHISDDIVHIGSMVVLAMKRASFLKEQSWFEP